MNDNTRQQLATDLRLVLDDVQTLLSQAAQSTGEQAQHLRGRAAEQLQRAQARLGDLQHDVADRSQAAMQATDHWVQMHPWGAVSVGAAVGFLVGLLVSRS